MSQDFADHPFEGRHHLPAWLWLIAGLLLGALLVVLWVLFWGEDTHTHHLKMVPRAIMGSVQSPPHKKAAVQTASATQTATKKARFEFYQTLTAPAAAAKPATLGSPKLAHKPPSSLDQYLLQVASVQRFADADRLKAELALLGYEVSMRKVFVKNHHWHRISVGPYHGLRAAQQAKKALSKNNIKSMLLKTKP